MLLAGAPHLGFLPSEWHSEGQCCFRSLTRLNTLCGTDCWLFSAVTIHGASAGRKSTPGCCWRGWVSLTWRLLGLVFTGSFFFRFMPCLKTLSACVILYCNGEDKNVEKRLHFPAVNETFVRKGKGETGVFSLFLSRQKKQNVESLSRRGRGGASSLNARCLLLASSFAVPRLDASANYT